MESTFGQGDYISIDGSEEEGGGQMFRMSIALSQILSIPVEIYNIRANRTPPGLKDQHLTGLKTIAELSNATIEGDRLKSSTVKYCSKGTIEKSEVKAECSGAGSMNLIMQMVLPSILFAKGIPEASEITVKMKGGSIGNWAPSELSVCYVLQPLLSKFGIDFDYFITKRGFYPDLRGACDLICKPASLPLKSINLTSRDSGVKSIEIHSVYCGDIMKDLYDTMISGVVLGRLKEELSAYKDIPYKNIFSSCSETKISNPKTKACSLCCICVIHLHSGAILYTDVLIDGMKFAKDIRNGKLDSIPCDEKIEHFIQEIIKFTTNPEICVDEHHADQLLIYMALAEGTSAIRTVKPVTGHINGMIGILKQFLPDLKIYITEHDESTQIEIEGIGLKH